MAQEQIYKVDNRILSGGYKQDCYDFWLDADFYFKNDRLKLSENERLRREKVKEEKNKFKFID